MNLGCDRARPLLPAYLDGELGGESAHDLRQHLMDCQACRTAAQGERSLKRWFQAAAPVAVPAGFAARVARRAFAGDEGSPLGSQADAEPAIEHAGRLHAFFLQATVAAAVLLIVLVGFLRSVQLPAGGGLRAEDQAPPALEELLRELDGLERQAPTLEGGR